MRKAALFAGLALLAMSCTGANTPVPTAPSEISREPQVRTSPTTALPGDGLTIGTRTPTDGWVVMADGFGVNVAGGGTLQNIDPKTGRSSKAARIGSWDYDFTTMGRLGEGSLWLASGHDLWFIGGSPNYSVGRHYELSRLGYLVSVYKASPAAGGGTWLATAADNHHRAVIAEFDPDSGRVIRRFEVGGSGVSAIADSDGFIVASDGAGIIRLNPRTGQMQHKHLSATPQGFAATRGEVWWTSNGGTVNCVEVETLANCGTVDIPRASTLSSDGPRLWVLSVTGSKNASTYVPDPSQPATVTLMNGITGEVLAGPVALPRHTPASLTSYDGHAWVGFHDAGAVVRIDRANNGG